MCYNVIEACICLHMLGTAPSKKEWNKDELHIPYFAFGLDMDQNYLENKIGSRVHFFALATLQNYHLTYIQTKNNPSGIVDAFPKVGSHVKGVIYFVKESQMREINREQRSQGFVKPLKVKLFLDETQRDQQKTIMTTIYVNYRNVSKDPTPHYQEKLVQAATHAGLSENYKKELEELHTSSRL